MGKKPSSETPPPARKGKLVGFVLLLAVAAAIAVGLVAALGRGDEARMARLVARWQEGGGGNRDLEITYPRPGALFPVDFHAPTFLWKDGSGRATRWIVAVSLPGTEEPELFLASEPRWTPSAEAWAEMKTASTGRPMQVSVVGAPDESLGEACSAGAVEVSTSEDPVGAPIFFRDVPLPFIYAVRNTETIRWRLGTVSSEEEAPILLENLPVCGNCHSFSRDGTVLGMDADYANDKGSYAIVPVEKNTVLSPDRVITWSDFKREDDERTYGLLSQVSPCGRYAISTVKDRSVFVPKPDLSYSQLFFPVKGILVVYDREAKSFTALSGADDRTYVNSNPTWSPDGKWIYFARAKATKIEGAGEVKGVILPAELVHDFVSGGREFKFDLYRVPFNEGAGGQAEPVPGASGNGLSNYFPRLSPDGKWLVFCQAKNFMLLQPDSALYIMPAAGGEPRRMTCNTGNMNSWHSWSPNGRWLVFTSKERGAYTQLWLTHVDDEGRDTPPVVLENLIPEGRAANIPEFVPFAPGAIERISEAYLTDFNYQRQADMLAQGEKKLDMSIKYYRKAIELNPENLEARNNLGATLHQLGKVEEALEQFAAVLAQDPQNVRGLINMGIFLQGKGQFEEAQSKYELVLALEPNHPKAMQNLGMIYSHRNELDRAESMFRRILDLRPDSPKAHLSLGWVLEKRGRDREARTHFLKAVEFVPDMIQESLDAAQSLLQKTGFEKELEKLLNRIVQEKPRLGPVHSLLGQLYDRLGRLEEAIQAFEFVRQVDPEGAPDWIPQKISEMRSRLASRGK